ncbi:MAG: hypothetical protein PVI90_06370 [Desulfobacteraceae bacterium]|jgi:hypothetical protein
MPTIGNNPNTFLHGLSDFWTRFYADYKELIALYHGTEVLLAQTYLDMLSSFLNISIAETPIFNTEYFKVIFAREDLLVYDAALDTLDDRYILAMPDNIVEAHILQNKVIEPTASVEEDSGYQIDGINYEFRFEEDPSGQALKVLDTTNQGSLVTYGTGALTKFYVPNTENLFAYAKTGHWLCISNSTAGNDLTYCIGQVLNAQTVLLQGTFTLPETNNGALQGTLLDSEFSPLAGFAHRTMSVEVAGVFDDLTRRKSIHDGGTLEVASWYATPPVGLGIRKGDIIRVFDKDAVPSVPMDFKVAVVRHNKLYIHKDYAIPITTTTVNDYVILREPANTNVEGEQLTFVKTNQDKGGVLGSVVYSVGLQEVVFTLDPTTPVVDRFQSSDKSRYLTIKTGGLLTCTCSLTNGGILTRTSGTVANPGARLVPTGQIKITGSAYGQDGVYTVKNVISDTVLELNTSGFIPESIDVALTWLSGSNLDGVSNIGTYKIKKYHDEFTVTLDLPVCYNDPNNGTIEWELHDGYIATLNHQYVNHKSTKIYAGAGNSFTGGLHDVVENVEFVVNETDGKITQIGRFAGTWGLIVKPLIDYSWLYEILSTSTNGVFDSTTTEVLVTEVAMWAPDVSVDKFHLYQNYGYLINRFQASSESYREFIRGVFQLYILGPTLQRIESALNVVVNMPVIRDDGEILIEYNTSDIDYDYIYTLRPDGSTAEYQYIKGTPIRTDITTWVSGDANIVFESFESLTTLFEVTDYVEDPTWWESIVIPSELMPIENTQRRTTVPLLYENIINQIDDPRIGDPGFFIGADDEGFVPANIATYPAKRRKMANVVMNTFLKYHMFFVRFDSTIYSLVEGTFIQDIIELVITAKPSYKYIYIEPASDLRDTLRLVENAIEVQPTVNIPSEVILLGNTGLTISSLSWNIGDVWRFNPTVPSEALPITTPTPTPPADPWNDLTYENVTALRILKDGAASGLIEYVDYRVDYKLGYVYPLVEWPSGTYTAEYASILLSPHASRDASLGDTDYTIGGQNPTQVRHHHNPMREATITNVLGLCSLIDTNATFIEALHVDQKIYIYEPTVRILTIRRVVSETEIIFDEADVSAAVETVVWDFGGEEHYDGIAVVSDIFKSATAIFRERDLDRYIYITGSTGNDGYHRIKEVQSMYQVKVDSTLSNETNIHWRMEGSPRHMDLIERPVQITMTTV